MGAMSVAGRPVKSDLQLVGIGLSQNHMSCDGSGSTSNLHVNGKNNLLES